MAKPPSEAPLLRRILAKLKSSHPALATKLHHDPAANEWSFVEPTGPHHVEVKVHDLQSTSALLKSLSAKKNSNSALTPCHLLLEREMNDEGSWSDPGVFPLEGINVICAGVYALSEAKCAIVLRLHASVCDRTTAVSLLRELMELTAEADGVAGKGTGTGLSNDGEGKMGIEGMIPAGKAKKTIWAHGVDMLGYSVNSFRLSNLKFKDTKLPRFSEVVRMQMDARQTAGIFAGCKSRGIKLCGALAAAALIAAHSTKNETDQLTKKKYGVVTLIDCRPHLEPALSPNHYGFYHAAVLNTHTLKGSEIFWDLASQTYTDFLRYKKCNKHFSDMADISFLMRKAMENPTLTASSSLRTSLVSVFEDPVIDDSGLMRKSIGVEDYLDCAFVYPSPLHSREQIAELVGRMKKILVQESSN
ncbi:Unknown protein [Striga hermonthica]|uniref:Uncharacterized protein n=1 Tax=Striga hermonthica TaxID=68872 RepID=A0A9N7RRI1_STRHE|nr:Unknown protein [Striga hermonthica]